MEDPKETFKEKMRVLKYHLYIQNEHYREYNEIKTNMKRNEILLYIDFAESYQIRRKMTLKVLTLATTISVLLQLALTYTSLSFKTLDKRSVAIVTEASGQSRIVMILKIIHSLTLKVMNRSSRLTFIFQTTSLLIYFRDTLCRFYLYA